MVTHGVILGGVFMAYFLKKINQKGRTYLSIVESFYDPKKKGTSHKSYKALGSVETNIAKGIKDPPLLQ